MGFGARGPCGQRVRPVVVQGLGRESDRAIVLLLSLAASLAVAPRDKLETAVTGRVQVKNISVSKVLLCFLSQTDPESSCYWLQSSRENEMNTKANHDVTRYVFSRACHLRPILIFPRFYYSHACYHLSRLPLIMWLPALSTGPEYAFNFSSLSSAYRASFRIDSFWCCLAGLKFYRKSSSYLAPILCSLHQWMVITRNGLPGLPVIRLVALAS